MSTKTLQIATLDNMEGREVEGMTLWAEIEWWGSNDPTKGYVISDVWLSPLPSGILHCRLTPSEYYRNQINTALENEDGIARDAAIDRKIKEGLV